MWRNIGLEKIKYASTETFATNTGMKLRRMINPLYRRILWLAMSQRVHVDARYPLEKNTPYIFAASHSCIADVIANMAYIDRSAYMLVGTTDQIDHNPQMYAAWLNGIIYVDRLDPKSRKSALDKMERILKSGQALFFSQRADGTILKTSCVGRSLPVHICWRKGRIVKLFL